MNTIEEFREIYVRLCKDNHVETQDCVLNQLKSAQLNPEKSHGGYALNLSTFSLGVKTCVVLAKTLATDRTFTEVKFNDCMLPEEAVKAIAHGMAGNVHCKKLDLKGNNIRGTATEALGRMLRKNKTLKSLCLEWNAMGMVDSAFGVFCEGLGSNTGLQVLDLRNNQISHDGARELETSLKRNTTLRWLDLRWNNIGLIGGRAILNSLQYNKTVTKLELAGNNTPNDIMNAIDSAVQHNADRAGLQNEYEARSQLLCRQLEQTKNDRKHEMTELMNTLDRQESALKQSTRSANQRVKQLQEALDDNRSQFNELASKLSLTESELQLAESKVKDLGSLLARAKQENDDTLIQHQNELRRERDERTEAEGRLVKELMETNTKNVDLMNKVDELERKCKAQQEQIYDYKEKLAHVQADLKLKSSHFDEKIQLEKQKCRDAIKEADEIRQREVARVRQEAEESERGLKERIQRLENQRLQLEEELSHQKTVAMSERVNMDEQLANAKQRIKREEEQRFRQLEDKHHLLQMSKDDLEQHSSNLSSTVSELQSKNANLVLENETLRRKIEELNQEVSGKNQEMMAEVGKVKIDLTQKIQRLENERMTQKDMYDKVDQLKQEVADWQSKYNSTMESKDKEIHELREQVKCKDGEIKRMRDEDTQRASFLQSAIQSYVSRSPFAGGT